MKSQTQIKILHTADLHLGHTVSPDAVSKTYKDIVKQAPYNALKKLVAVAVENQVDAFILAGDIFDKGPKPKIFDAFIDALRPLESAGIRVLIACGNHDGYNTWQNFMGKIPPNVFVFSAQVMQAFNLKDENANTKCQFIGQSLADKGYMQKSLVESLKVSNFSGPEKAPVRVGVLHIGTDEDKQAPVDMINFAQSGCDYIALGHIHKSDIQRFNNVAISYCGTPQGQDIGEPARQSFDGNAHGYFANLVTINKNADKCSVNVEQVPCTNVVFKRLSVDVSGANGADEIVQAVYQKTLKLKKENNCAYLICRIELTGMTQMHNWLVQRQHIDDLREEICKTCNIECSKLCSNTQMLYDEKQLLDAGGVPSLIVEVSHQFEKDKALATETIQQFLNANKKIPVDSAVIDNLNIQKLVADAQIEAVSAVSPKLKEE